MCDAIARNGLQGDHERMNEGLEIRRKDWSKKNQSSQINRRFNIKADCPHSVRRAESCSHLHQHWQREGEEDEGREKCIPNHLEHDIKSHSKMRYRSFRIYKFQSIVLMSEIWFIKKTADAPSSLLPQMTLSYFGKKKNFSYCKPLDNNP